MSKYTTEVRFICEQYSGLTESVGLGGVDKVIESARRKVFDFAYPIFDEAYRSVLETKILKHFYTREIGAETVGLWKLWLNRKMNEIMPYYNKLYKSELLEFNPLYDVDITREHSGTKVGTKQDTGESSGAGTTTGKIDNTESGTNSGNRLDTYADTPQGAVMNLENETYLTNARKLVDSGTTQTTGNTVSENTTENSATSRLNSTINDTEEYLEHVSGKQGGQSYAKMLLEYRTTFLNIDMQVINELNDLFMNLW